MGQLKKGLRPTTQHARELEKKESDDCEYMLQRNPVLAHREGVSDRWQGSYI